ncbi:hypothetical protein GCM10025858_27590 [Alicyclobacillus sacchari]|nr:hypothetical protein GCM10025858_27590 [Alicyclobacillus sacchari]
MSEGMDDLVRRLLHAQVMLVQMRRVVSQVPGTPSKRLATSTREECGIIDQILSIARTQTPDPEHLKERLTALYHADATTQRSGKEWVRWLAWERGSASYRERRGVERLLHVTFHELAACIPTLVGLYGEQETKYIAPVEYRPQTAREV